MSEEHVHETTASRPDSVEQRRSERIERLLAGEALDTSELAYDLGAHRPSQRSPAARGPGMPSASSQPPSTAAC